LIITFISSAGHHQAPAPQDRVLRLHPDPLRQLRPHQLPHPRHPQAAAQRSMRRPQLHQRVLRGCRRPGEVRSSQEPGRAEPVWMQVIPVRLG
jgi:hypothetical protein